MENIQESVRGWAEDAKNNAGMIILLGVVTVIAGFLLLREWPLTGLWAIGTLVGINLLFAGFSMISIGSAARKLVRAAA